YTRDNARQGKRAATANQTRVSPTTACAELRNAEGRSYELGQVFAEMLEVPVQPDVGTRFGGLLSKSPRPRRSGLGNQARPGRPQAVTEGGSGPPSLLNSGGS